MKIRLIMLALSLMALNAHAQYYDYDVNKDGEVNVTDVTFLVNKILGQENPAPRRPLNFSVSQNPIVSADGPASSRRKTPETIITSDEDNPGRLDHFFVNCTYPSDYFPYDVFSIPEMKTKWQNIEGGQGKWFIGDSDDSGNGHWPSDVSFSSNVKFYAYANVDDEAVEANISKGQYADNNVLFICDGYNPNHDVSNPYLHFIMDEGSATTKDLLVATQEDNLNHCQGNISFLFEHACAAAKFFLVKSSKLVNYDVYVTQVTLKNVVAEGDYFFNTKEWEFDRYDNPDDLNNPIEIHKTVYTLWDSNQKTIEVPDYPNPITVNGKTRENTSQMKQLTSSTDPNNDYFFFIPYQYQYANPDKDAYIEIVCKITPKEGSGNSFVGSEGNGAIARIPFSTRYLEMGKWYPIVIKMGTSMLDSHWNYIFDVNGNIISSQ